MDPHSQCIETVNLKHNRLKLPENVCDSTRYTINAVNHYIDHLEDRSETKQKVIANYIKRIWELLEQNREQAKRLSEFAEQAEVREQSLHRRIAELGIKAGQLEEEVMSKEGEILDKHYEWENCDQERFDFIRCTSYLWSIWRQEAKEKALLMNENAALKKQIEEVRMQNGDPVYEENSGWVLCGTFSERSEEEEQESNF